MFIDLSLHLSPCTAFQFTCSIDPKKSSLDQQCPEDKSNILKVLFHFFSFLKEKYFSHCLSEKAQNILRQQIERVFIEIQGKYFMLLIRNLVTQYEVKFRIDL